MNDTPNTDVYTRTYTLSLHDALPIWMRYFTKNQIKKPIYYAYYFLSKLGDQLIAKGDGYFITKSPGKYVIIRYHFVQFTDHYAKGVTFNTTAKERYNAFSEVHPTKMYFSLGDLGNGTYDVYEHFFNRKYGSALDQQLPHSYLSANKHPL